MKTKFFYGMAALATLGLSACSSEDLGTTDPGKAEVDQTQFVTIQISSPRDATRADYEHGVPNESNVESLDFLFYDVNGNPTAARQRFSKTDGTWNNAASDTEFEDGNVTRIWTNIVPVQLTQGQNLPAQVVCLVNTTVDRAVEIANMTLDELRNAEAPIFSRANNQFLMSNSVYFGTNVLTGAANQRLCATPINAAQLFPTRDAAQAELEKIKNDPDGANALLVDIYVERLAAKVGLTMAPAAIQPYNLKDSEGNDVVLNYVPEYWFVNATSNSGYITKRYGVSESVTTTDGEGNTVVTTTINMKPSFDQIDVKFEGTGMEGGQSATGWNFANNHRSFWACSPSYYTATYPMVSDEVNDLEDNTTEKEYAETYYSYNDIKNSTKIGVESIAVPYNAADGFVTGISADNAATTGFIYTRETTASIGQINGHKNPAAVIASAVVVGHYQVGTETTPHDFYVDRNDGDKGVYYADFAAAKAALAARQGAIFKAVTTGEGEAATTTYEPLTETDITTTYADNFTVEHPKAAVRALLANKNLAGRLVTLQMTSLPTTALYIFDVTTSTYVAITDGETGNMATANKNLCGAGYFDMFKNGIAFYSVPIRHLGFGVNVAADKPLYTGDAGKPIKYNWKNMRLGDLGVVRNHVYNLTITSIGQGLGTGVRDENQPIVPPVDVTESYIAMRLNILAWNIANSWSVDL